MVWAMGRWLPQPGIAGSSAVPRLALLRVRTRGALSVALVGSAVSVVTVSNRFGPLPLRDVAASERAVDEGRVWLLVSSAFVADVRDWDRLGELGALLESDGLDLLIAPPSA